MSNTNLPQGLAPRNDGKQVKCLDCNGWAWNGDPIRHRSRCDTPALQAPRQTEVIPPETVPGLTAESYTNAGERTTPAAQRRVEEAAEHNRALWGAAMNSDF